MKKFKYSEITPEKIYNDRRSFIKSMGYGLGALTLSSVPLINAKAGNHIEIMHRTDSDANFFYPNIMGGKYQSGVISVTGLNVIQTTGHLITNYVQQDWPHRNVIHTTGLNLTTTTGNLTYSHAEPDWPHAHVVHTTGLNLSQATGHLIQQYQEPSWPYRNVVHSTGVNLRPDSDSNLSITRDASWPHSGVISQSGNRLYAANNSSNSDFPKTQGANNGLGFTFDRTSGGKGAVALFNMNKNKHTSTTQTINHGGSGVNYTVAGTFDSNKTLTVTTSHINDDIGHHSIKNLSNDLPFIFISPFPLLSQTLAIEFFLLPVA